MFLSLLLLFLLLLCRYLWLLLLQWWWWLAFFVFFYPGTASAHALLSFAKEPFLARAHSTCAPCQLFCPDLTKGRFPVILRLSSDELPPCIKTIQPCRYTCIFSQLWFPSPWISCLAICEVSIVNSAFFPSLA